MRELRREGKGVKEIARIFEVSPRTVQRWLKAVEAALLPCHCEAKAEAISSAKKGLRFTQDEGKDSLRNSKIKSQESK
jgi:transposase